MNNALTAILNQSEKKIDSQIVAKGEQLEDIQKMISIISKQDEKIEMMNQEINILKTEISQIKSNINNKIDDKPEKNDVSKKWQIESKSQIKIQMTISTMNQ